MLHPSCDPINSEPAHPFPFAGLPDESPADLAEAMDFFLADAADDLTEWDLQELAVREAERALSEEIKRAIASARSLSDVLVEVFPFLAKGAA